MKTFQELYCLRHGCQPQHFTRAIFWQSLHRHAVVIAPFLGGYLGAHFAADRELLRCVADARSLDTIRDEIREHFMDSTQRRLSRRWGRIRVSTKRLKKLARSCFRDAQASESTDAS